MAGYVRFFAKSFTKNSIHIALLFGALMLGIVAGWSAPAQDQQAAISSFKEVAQTAPFGDNFSLFIFIFLHNLYASVLLFFSGVLIVLPFLIIMSQGFLLGTIIYQSTLLGLPNLAQKLAASLLPHGVLEMPAVLLASALGIDAGLRFMFSKKSRKKALFGAIMENSMTFIKIVIPLLLLASAVETYITPQVLGAVSHDSNPDTAFSAPNHVWNAGHGQFAYLTMGSHIFLNQPLLKLNIWQALATTMLR